MGEVWSGHGPALVIWRLISVPAKTRVTTSHSLQLRVSTLHFVPYFRYYATDVQFYWLESLGKSEWRWRLRESWSYRNDCERILYLSDRQLGSGMIRTGLKSLSRTGSRYTHPASGWMKNFAEQTIRKDYLEIGYAPYATRHVHRQRKQSLRRKKIFSERLSRRDRSPRRMNLKSNRFRLT